MVRYRFNQQKVPPAPFIHVAIRRVDGLRELTDVVAQLDTGADITVLPASFVHDMELVPYREISVAGLGGVMSIVSTYLVHVIPRDLPGCKIEAIASAGEIHVLLGRDVLNRFNINLNGPGLVFEVE